MGGRVPIRFGTYNICNGRNGGLELALRGMTQANIDLGIFQEKKIPMEFIPSGRKDTALFPRLR